MSVARSFWEFCACARTTCAKARAPTAAAHNTATLKRFIRPPLLNNVLPQLVVVRPATFRGGIQKLIRIFPLARKAIESAAVEHVLGAFPGPHPIENALTNFLHHVPLRLELRLGHDSAVRRDEPGLI